MRRRRPLRCGDPCRPLAARPRRLRAHQLRRDQRPVRPRHSVGCRPVRPRQHRRGVRIDRGRFLLRNRCAQSPVTVLGVQGRQRPDRPGVSRHPRPAGGGHPVVEPVRPLPVPREAHPVLHHHSDGGWTCPLYGDGLNVRDWFFVEDNCAAIDLVSRKGMVGEIYNIGAHNERTNRRDHRRGPRGVGSR